MGSALKENKFIKQKSDTVLPKALLDLAGGQKENEILWKYIKENYQIISTSSGNMKKEKSIQHRNSGHSQRTVTSSHGLKNDRLTSQRDDITKLDVIR